MRAVMFWHIPNLLLKFKAIKSNTILLMVRIVTCYIIIVLTSSGFIFLVNDTQFLRILIIKFGPSLRTLAIHSSSRTDIQFLTANRLLTLF